MNKNPLLYLFKKMWHYSGEDRKIVTLFWSMFVFANLLTLLARPFLIAQVINLVQLGLTSENIQSIFILLGALVLVEIIFWALHGPARYLETRTAFRTRLRYRSHLLSGIMALPLEWHSEHASGNTIDKINKGTDGLYSFSESTFEIIYAIVELVGSLIILAHYSLISTPIALVMLMLAVTISMRLDKILVRQWRELNHAENSIAEKMYDAISNISTVVILRVEKLIFKTVVAETEKPFPLFKRNNRVNEVKWFLMSLTNTTMTVLVLGVYIYQNVRLGQVLLIGNLYLMIKYLDNIGTVFFKFTQMYSQILKFKTRVENAEELAVDFREESFNDHVLPDDWQTISVKNLNFSYLGVEEGVQHLDDVSVEIAHGEKIALVGKTGSGKTTFLKLFRDLYHPESLELAVDGVLVPHGFGGINQAITLIPQDPEIFDDTIWHNITLGAEHSKEEVDRACDVACFSEVVKHLPNGYDSAVNERGVKLSGGEKQRLALARGLLACADKSIILLDEPTSSMDAKTSLEVFKNIFSAYSGKTILSTIHSLNLIPFFDRVMVFDEGKLVGFGTHDELVADCQAYQELQSGHNGQS
ncbi:MAG TPA: ABC transporter ATP-binding protein [Candidatus Paceibacterota bacterium]